MENYSVATIAGMAQAEKPGANQRTYKKINTPFGYFGSKNKIALQLCRALPPHHCWVEAFCGSAALTLSKTPAPIEVINDINGEIVNVFKQLRDNHQELCRAIALTPYARQEFRHVQIHAPKDNGVERARKFLVQSMMAVNGVFGKERGGFSYSQAYSRNGRDARVNRWYNLPERLERVVERLRGIRIENRDAIDLLAMFGKRPATLVYLDPPYLGNRSKGYIYDANDETYHQQLLNIANKAKCMIFISGYESKLYNTLLTEAKGWKRETFEAITKGTNGDAHSRREVVWMNKHFQRSVQSGKIRIRLTSEEIKQNKVNPER